MLKSIENPIQPESIVFDAFDEISAEQRDRLNSIKEAAGGGFYAWGAEPRGHASSTWGKMSRGDYVLAYYHKGYHYVARVLAPFHKAKLATNIWDVNEDTGNTWEYMYFLTEPKRIDAPARWVADLLGRTESNLKYQSFSEMAGDNREAILQRFGSVQSFINRLIGYDGDDTPPELLIASAKSEAVAEASLDVDEVAHGYGLEEHIHDEEGRKSIGQHVRYERSSRNRALAIEKHGTACAVCRFDFDDFYGADYADGYIQVHHKKPLSEHQGRVNPATDLVPLCANCHVMAHRRKDTVTSIEELKELIEKAKS